MQFLRSSINMYPHLYGSEDSNKDTIRRAALDLTSRVNEIFK